MGEEWFLLKFASEDDAKANLSRLGNSTRKISRGSLLACEAPSWDSMIRNLPILTPPPLVHYEMVTPLEFSTVQIHGIKKGNLSTNNLIDNMIFLYPKMAWEYGRLKWFSTAHDVPSGVEFEYFGPGLYWKNKSGIKTEFVQESDRGIARWLAFLEKVYAENWTPFIDKQEGDEHLPTYKR